MVILHYIFVLENRAKDLAMHEKHPSYTIIHLILFLTFQPYQWLGQEEGVVGRFVSPPLSSRLNLDPRDCLCQKHICRIYSVGTLGYRNSLYVFTKFASLFVAFACKGGSHNSEGTCYKIFWLFSKCSCLWHLQSFRWQFFGLL